MTSSEPSVFFDLPWGFPVTPEAVQILRENPLKPGKGFWEQFQRAVDLLDRLPEAEEASRKRRTFAGCEPFEL
jgi:hypothetical protein